MVWVDTETIVALVQHVEIVRNGSKFELPRNAMRISSQPIETSIAVGSNGSRPIPTVVQAYNDYLSPEQCLFSSTLITKFEVSNIHTRTAPRACVD